MWYCVGGDELMTVKTGNARGLIALYLDYEDAWAIVDAFPYPDRAGTEMLDAIKEAYPGRLHDDGLCEPDCYYCETETTP